MVNKTKSKAQITNYKLRRGDTVKVLAGKDRGKTAKIMAMLPKQGKALVEGVNMIKKHIRPRRAGEKGQRVEVASPIDTSNLQLVCPACKKTTRVGIQRPDGRRQRVCKKCEAVVDKEK